MSNNFYKYWRDFLNENNAKKERTSTETLFYFQSSEIENLNSYFREKFNFSLNESPYLIRPDEAGEDEWTFSKVAEATEWEIPPSAKGDEVQKKKNFDSQIVNLNKVKKNRKSLKTRVADLTASDYEEKEWVLVVPNEVLDNIEKIINTAKEASESFTSGLYKDAKEWYFILNKLSTYGVGIPEEKGDEGLFAMLLAVFSPMTQFQANYREAILAYRAIKIDIANGNEEDLYKYISLKGMRGSKNANLFLEEFPHLAIAHYWAKISFSAGAKWNNFCVVVKTYLKSNGLDLKETSRLLQSDLNNIKTNNIRLLGLGEKTRNFIGRTKVTNFALNIVDPAIGSVDPDYLLNVTIDTWMTRAFYPGIEISAEIMNDPYSYFYIVGHVVNKAKEHNMLPHEMQAIIWVHMLKEDKPNVAATASEMSNLFSGLVKAEIAQLESFQETKLIGFDRVLNASNTLQSRVKTYDDFKNIRKILGLKDTKKLAEWFEKKFGNLDFLF